MYDLCSKRKPRWHFWYLLDYAYGASYQPLESRFWRLLFDRTRTRVCVWLYRRGYWQLPPAGDVIWSGRLTLNRKASFKKAPWRNL